MNETNNLFSAAMAALGMVLADFYGHLAPWLLLGMVLVFVDLRFGVLAARVRGEEIRPSRAEGDGEFPVYRDDGLREPPAGAAVAENRVQCF